MSVETVGVEVDSDGYILRFDDRSIRTLANADQATITGLPTGTHSVGLDGIAPNCTPSPALPAPVQLVADRVTSFQVTVRCEFIFTHDLAYAAKVDGQWEIFLRAAQDGRIENLTRSPGNDSDLAWSPDGSSLAFVSDRGGGSDIYILRLEERDLLRLTTASGGDVGPQWSPDGNRLLFVSHRDGNAEVYVMNADGSGQVNLTNEPVPDTAPSWSPDGNSIVFVSLRGDPRSDLIRIRPDGSDWKLIAGDTLRIGDDQDPVWSPDGTEILFWTDEPDNPELPYLPAATVYRGPPDSTSASPLVGGTAHSARWSPDGTRLLFAAYEVTEPAGGARVRPYFSTLPGSLQVDTRDGRGPTWSPDGKFIAFVRNGIEAVDTSGAGFATLVADPAGVEQIADIEWRPGVR